MSKRFFTSDLHLGSAGIIGVLNRPFKNVDRMNEMLIRNCNQRAKGQSVSVPVYDRNGQPVYDMKGNQIFNKIFTDRDILIHVGDFCEYGDDNHYKDETLRKGSKINPGIFISKFDPIFINIEGNHDAHNKVKSACTCMRTTLGRKYLAVSIGHYPSTDPKAKGTFRRGDIHIHGHCHTGPKFTIDFENQVLNINVCCDLWNYHPVSEDELIRFVDKIMKNKGKI